MQSNALMRIWMSLHPLNAQSVLDNADKQNSTSWAASAACYNCGQSIKRRPRARLNRKTAPWSAE